MAVVSLLSVSKLLGGGELVKCFESAFDHFFFRFQAFQRVTSHGVSLQDPFNSAEAKIFAFTPTVLIELSLIFV